jgi:hypothetical protein
MGFEHDLEPAKGELPLVIQTPQPKKACRFVPRRRAVAVGLLVGLALWFAHRRCASTSEPLLEEHLDLLGYDIPHSLTGKEVEELFL